MNSKILTSQKDIDILLLVLDDLIFDENIIDYDTSVDSDNTINKEDRKNRKDCSFSVGIVPKVTLTAFFNRILKHSKLQKGTFIALMIYLDKAVEKILLNKYNVHRLILGALVCSMKYTCDRCFNNLYFAKLGGITPEEMCNIEFSFLEILDYNLYISDDEYSKYSSLC